MTNVEIRRATINDAPAIATILRELGWVALVNEETAESTQKRVEHHLWLCLADASHSVYVAEKEAEVIGYAAAHWLPYLILAGPEGYVSELFLRDTARGQGIGTALLETVRAEAEERGCARLMLLNIRNRESYQRRFYKKLGWQERELTANFVLPLK
jgi:GNAT superfamily N-acetyltransferase